MSSRGIKKKYGAELIFLESSDETLFRRFKETRRTHPFLDVSNIKDALAEEREQVGWIKEIADKVIDTSLFTTHGLRNFVISTYGTGEKRMKINLISFGYAYGIPLEADIVQDVRFLPNPFFVEGLREKTGLVARGGGVHDGRTRDSTEFFPMLLDFLVNLIPLFEREGKSYLTICIGCTGRETQVRVRRERAGRTPAHDGLQRLRDAQGRRQGGAMIGIVVVAHFNLAREMVAATELIVGKQDQFEYVDIFPDEEVDKIKKEAYGCPEKRGSR